MIRMGLRRRLSGFRSRQEGSATVEFAIVVPLLLMVVFSTVELGLITLRQSQLERALDQTVRGIRLNTGSAPQHDAIRDEICARSGFVDNCETSLRLKMIRLDPYNWNASEASPSCITKVEEVTDPPILPNGDSNELMLIYACMKLSPIFPTWGLGEKLAEDEDDGRFALYASSAFVQEPK